MTNADAPGGALDVPTLQVMGRRAASHPLVEHWRVRPDAVTPGRLDIALDVEQFPAAVDAARLDVRWFEDGTYTIHDVETRGNAVWQCRWDRHPKPGAPMDHFHPPPDAASDIEASPLGSSHPLGVLFSVFDWIEERVTDFHKE